MSEDLDIAQQAVSRAQRAGVTDADAWLTSEKTFSVTVRGGDVEQVIEAGSRTLALRIFLDDRRALVYSSDLVPDALERLVDDAVALARLADPDPCAGLPEAPAALGDGTTLDLVDPDLFTHDPKELIALARRTEAAARGFDPRITNSEGAVFSRWQGSAALANSRDVAGEYAATSCDLWGTALVEDADNKKREGWWYTADRHLDRLEDAEAVGRMAAERAIRQLGARKVPTRQVPVVWSPEMAQTFVMILSRAASGEARYRGNSFLIGHEGETIAAPLLTITDDATLPGRLGSRPFDGEGLPSRRTALFEKGRFDSFLYDTYSGRKADRASTANAGRWADFRLGVTIGVQPTNLVMEPGPTAPDAIISGIDQGLYLTELLGAGENLTTGDFSRGAAGIWIDGGELTYPVTEINIAGRLQDMLTGIDAVGNDLDIRGTIAAPTFRVAQMMVSGT